MFFLELVCQIIYFNRYFYILIYKANKYSFMITLIILFIIHLFFNSIYDLFINYKNKIYALIDLSIVILLTAYCTIQFYKIKKWFNFIALFNMDIF